jgi:uncharacterized protein (DUF1778 family)
LQSDTSIDHAAEAVGSARFDFMLDTVCRAVETVLFDRHSFVLSDEAFQKFTAMLDKPPEDNPKLRRLLATKAPWDRAIGIGAPESCPLRPGPLC